MTPPTGASKPTYQPSARADEPADTSYFPEQVSLNLGGGGFGAPPAQSSSLQSFQPMDSAPLAQAPAPQPAMLPALGTQPSMGVPIQLQQQQQQPPQQEYQQQYQQPQPVHSLPSLQQQQQLPELADDPEPAAAAPPPPPPPPAPTDDIWSSLQSTYRIKDPPAGPSSAHSKASSGRGRKGAPGGEVLVLGDDDPFSGGKGMPAPNLNGTMNRTSGFGGRGSQAGALPPPRPAAAAKSGGWGAGNMAQAGELMIGAADDDWLEDGGARQQLPPAGGFGGRGAASNRSDEYGGGGSYNQPAAGLNKAPLAQGRPADDILCEDVEDVDMLLEDEMQGISDKNLANKLAAFDAQFNED